MKIIPNGFAGTNVQTLASGNPLLVRRANSRMNTLNADLMGPDITRMDVKPMGSPRADLPIGIQRTGPVTCTPIPFFLIAGQTLVIAAMDVNRVGMILQNTNAANALFYNFGANADINSARLLPGTTLLLDFICPTDQITVFGPAATSGIFIPMSRGAE